MSLFQFLKSKISILDVVREYVAVRQMGGYWKGSCPFHAETDASFTVSPDKQIFYCFGCHASGDVIGFIAKAENCNQFEASQHLIERYGIEVPASVSATASGNAEAAKKRDASVHLCDAVAAWLHEQLSESAQPRNYLEARDITQKEIAYFQLGYMPGGLRGINRFIKAMSAQNILVKDLVEHGVLTEGSNVYYSPFEERIIFPIRDGMGRTCGFGGRVFKPSDERAKYYNSKESPAFSKGKILFGLDLAKKEIQSRDAAFLVEGYTDCIAMVFHGYPNVVATLGTACTKDHLQQLSRHCSSLYVLYDGDAAGQKAILRLAQLCFEVNLELLIVQLPAKHDPATFLTSGGDLATLIAGAQGIFTFFVTSLGRSFAEAPLSEKLRLGDKIVELISRLGDRFKQDLLLQRAAEVLQVPLASLQKSLQNRPRLAASELDAAPLPLVDAAKEPLDAVSYLEKSILFAMIHQCIEVGEQVVIDEDLIPYFSLEIQKLIQAFQSTKGVQRPADRFAAFLSQLSEAEQAWVTRHSLVEAGASFKDLVLQFRRKKWKTIVQDLRSDMQQAQRASDTQKYQELVERFLKFKQGLKREGLL